jgi:ubiquitin-protein ligase
MDIQRIRLEVAQAVSTFAVVEAYPTNEGGVFVKAALQTSVGNTYIAAVSFPNYPNQMPKVLITAPALIPCKHQYTDGSICYLHPNMWNPGRHNLEFVLGRIAKWLNKYEVWRVRGTWPGAEIAH